MYLRNVKQILRAADQGFDERRYGFSGLLEFLRACQKESLIRLERDRRGGLRVFPGAHLQRAPSAPVRDEGDADLPSAPAEAAPGESVQSVVVGEPEVAEIETEPMPTVDPTAELLGTVKRKRTARLVAGSTRTRTAPAARKTTSRKPTSSTRRTTRAQKIEVKDGSGEA
jgi:hypothetical protein